MKALRERLIADAVHTLLVQFTDLHGVAKGKLVPLAQLPTVLQTGAGFAGPSIAGTGLPRTGPRSEFCARGDALAEDSCGSSVTSARLAPATSAPGNSTVMPPGSE